MTTATKAPEATEAPEAPAVAPGVASAMAPGIAAGIAVGVAPDRPDEPPERRCTRCGAVGTHYLTCPDLRLPAGFRFGEPRRGPGR